MTAKQIIDNYISFFKEKKHAQITNSPLVPENDPTTLFTSSGMQPLVPYLLGETHPLGTRLVNVQNCFRALDIDEVGDSRHTTFFRMLGNWSLGDYFKDEEIPWVWEFLTKKIGLPKEKLNISVFSGYNSIEKDEVSYQIWEKILLKEGLNPKEKITYLGIDKNWWSRSGKPDQMPEGEPGGPDTEIFYDFGSEIHESCSLNCDCSRFMEIGNAVFMEFRKTKDGFEKLPKRNVDYGGGLERILAAIEKKSDIFETSLFKPVINSLEKLTNKKYKDNLNEMRIIADHFVASVFITAEGVKPSKNEQGYILRRLLRRGFDNFYKLEGKDVTPLLEKVVEQYITTDPHLEKRFEEIKLTILEEEQGYKKTVEKAKKLIAISNKDDSTKTVKEITAEEAFKMYATHGLSPTQIKSLGYLFNEQEFAKKMKEHQMTSKKGAEKRFKGGLADTSEQTVIGHTATHLLHRALKDILGEDVNQKGSNITDERIRFDFNYPEKLSDEQIKKVENEINGKIEENLEVKSEVMTLEQAKQSGAVGLFDQKYEDKVKVYSIGDYSKEICGGPHVEFTGKLKRFKIIKQENIGKGLKRIYAKVGN